jgi:hypothetical protein
MSSTKAMFLTMADTARMKTDTSRMKIISILTAVFLPFTVVAVRIKLIVGSSKNIISNLIS